MLIYAKEQLGPHKYKTPEGYLICTDAILARTGKQTYLKRDFFKDCADGDTQIEVDRPAREVFSKEAKASFENKPLTIEHPDVDVNVDNYKKYSVGYVRDVHEGEYDGRPVLFGNLVVTDKEAISLIESGEMKELSCGYDCDVNDENNPVQTNIRGNHLALCQQGRAGIARIQDSVKDDTYKTVRYGFKTKELLKKFVDFVLQFDSSHDDFDVIEESNNQCRVSGLASSDKWNKIDETAKHFNFYGRDSIKMTVEKFLKKHNLKMHQIRLYSKTKNDELYREDDIKRNLYKEVLNVWEHNGEPVLKIDENSSNVYDSVTVEEISETRFIEYDDKEKKYFIASGDSRYEHGFDTKEEAKEFWLNNKELIRSKVAKDSVKDRHNWSIGSLVRYEGEWWTVINFSKGDWILENENREQVRVRDSVKDADTKSNLIRALDVLALKFKLLKEGTTWSGRKHFEFESVEKVNGFRTQMTLIDSLIERFDKAYNCRSTYNAMLKSDGKMNIVIDVDDRQAHDSVKDVEPKEGESKQEFISRFMSATKNEYPDRKQRLAVAYSYWDKQHTEDAIVDPKEVDTTHYLNVRGVRFAKSKRETAFLTKAYASNDGGKTWHTCYLEKKSSNADEGRTQTGKAFFRTSSSFDGGRTSIGRNVLTWYTNNGIHEYDASYQIDHVNGDYTDDRLSNLERVSPSENIRRMKAKLGKHDSEYTCDSKSRKMLKIVKIVSNLHK